MSGIVGIVNFDGQPVSRELLADMTGSLSFRAPDGNRIWIKDNVGFGHALLKTNSEENEPFPLTLDGETWLTAHARIDGRRELAKALSQHIPNLQKTVEEFPSDGTLILRAYQLWGKDCLQHLIGDFSFAIWDARRQQLFCARDQMGVGQFYYARVNGTFVFSNTLNCLRLHPAVSAKLNEIAIGDFLLFGLNQDRTSSIYADIQRLPRAHLLTATGGDAHTREYWTPSTTPVRYKSSSTYVERFKETLDAAVLDRLRSNQVAVAMSGGLDSSMIAATASAILKTTYASPELKAYCVAYGQAFPDDEKLYAGEVARALDIPIEYLEADLINQNTSPRTWGYAPEPFDVEPFYVVSDELLHRMSAGFRVGLTGWDGDTFMTESPKHMFYELWRRRKFGELSRALSSYVYFQRSPPPIGLRTWWQRRRGLVKQPPYPAWIDQGFEKRLGLLERWRQVTAERDAHPTRPYAFRNIDTPHWEALFARFDPGRTGLPMEVRHPLIDVRLVEYLLGLPVIPWILGKHILRESMRGVLPESIRTRRKTPLAGDPGLQLRYSRKVKEIDSFLPMPDVLNYIKRDAVPLLTTETDPASLWVNARPFSLNQWFRNSYNDSNSSVEQPNEDGEYSQNRLRPSTRSARTALHQAEVSQLR